YGILGVAEDYAATGVRYAKLQDAFVIWGNVEPEPGQYTWGPLDALVLEYQSAGFTGLQMDLTALSPWASSSPPQLSNQGDTFPKEEYLDDYQAYVTRVVERYDGDGTDDMPGLLYPVHDYGVEREFTGYWPGSAEEYVRLLRIAYSAIHAADPEARALLVALLLADVFDGNPDRAEVERRFAETPNFRKSLADTQTILAACDAYDIVDFHSLADYTEIPPTTGWIREQLSANGCGERPIWIGDAFPMSALIGFGGFVPPIPFAPTTLATRDQVVEALKAVADPASADHAAAEAWLRAETARGLVKKIVVSAAESLRGINVGNLEDWKTGLPAVDKTTVPMLGASMFMGLTDTTVTARMPGGKLPFNGHEWAKARKAGDPRPAFYAIQLAADKIESYSSVQQLDLGPGLWAYRFERSSGPLWVMWYDDGAIHLPGESAPSITAQLSVGADSAVVARTPTELGQTEPAANTISTDAGMLALNLDSTPVFVEANNR
ncbi:MAG: hypothetical protein HY260_17005, partial [Chloroflexi bacterium]|nr:hypothetical protein [Chloroflexota bacterium]